MTSQRRHGSISSLLPAEADAAANRPTPADIADGAVAAAIATTAAVAGPVAEDHLCFWQNWLVLNACDLTVRNPQHLQSRVEALARFLAEYAPERAVMVCQILARMPDAKTCEYPALIQRLRELAAIAGIHPVPPAVAAL